MDFNLFNVYKEMEHVKNYLKDFDQFIYIFCFFQKMAHSHLLSIITQEILCLRGSYIELFGE